MRKFVLILIILAAAAAGIYIGYVKSLNRNSIPNGPVLNVSFLDDRLGCAVLIKTPEGKWTLIDPGSSATSDELSRYLHDSGIESFGVIITNPYRDHCGALPALLESFKVTSLVYSGKLCRSHEWTDALKEIEKRGIASRIVVGGDTLQLSKSIQVSILGPAPGLTEGEPTSSDNNCMVVQISYGLKRILLASDIKTEAEAYLIKSVPNLDSDVLMLARNGGYGSNSLELMSQVKPAVCVISCGGRFGRPSPSVLKRIDTKNSGADIYRTDKDGTIDIITDGHKIIVNTSSSGQ